MRHNKGRSLFGFWEWFVYIGIILPPVFVGVWALASYGSWDFIKYAAFVFVLTTLIAILARLGRPMR